MATKKFEDSGPGHRPAFADGGDRGARQPTRKGRENGNASPFTSPTVRQVAVQVEWPPRRYLSFAISFPIFRRKIREGFRRESREKRFTRAMSSSSSGQSFGRSIPRFLIL